MRDFLFKLFEMSHFNTGIQITPFSIAHIVYLVLPYIHTAREGVERLGKLLETYGTYEMNGTSASTATNLWR